MAGFTQLALFCVAAMLSASPFVAALPSTKSGSIISWPLLYPPADRLCLGDPLTSAQEFNVDTTTATDQITFSHCTPAQERTISDVVPIAQRWALEAATYVESRPIGTPLVDGRFLRSVTSTTSTGTAQ